MQSYPAARRWRRASQALFLALFVLLLALPKPRIGFLQLDPLLAVSNALGTRTLYRGLLWSLAVLIPTLFFGRFFCGWVCPLGTLNHWASRGRPARRVASNRYRRWQALKYYLLVTLLTAALLGSALVGLFDPLALLARSLAVSILPSLGYAIRQPRFEQGFLLGALLIAILALNVRWTRFWCRALCPLGALLGAASR